MKIPSQIQLTDKPEDKSNLPTKSVPSSPEKRFAPLTQNTAVELKYDLQETVIPYPQVRFNNLQLITRELYIECISKNLAVSNQMPVHFLSLRYDL